MKRFSQLLAICLSIVLLAVPRVRSADSLAEGDLFKSLCELCKQSYKAPEAKITGVGGWELDKAWPNDDEVNATLMYNNMDHDFGVVVFRGTRLGFPSSDGGDILKDLALYFGTKGKNLVRAAEIVKEAKTRRPNLLVTGHSIGGTEAAYAAIENGVRALVFSSPGLPVSLSEEQRERASSKVLNVFLAGDNVAEMKTWWDQPLESRARGISITGTKQQGKCPVFSFPNHVIVSADEVSRKHVDALAYFKNCNFKLEDRNRIIEFLNDRSVGGHELAAKGDGADSLNDLQGTWVAANGAVLRVVGQSTTTTDASGFEMASGRIVNYSAGRLEIAWKFGGGWDPMRGLPGVNLDREMSVEVLQVTLSDNKRTLTLEVIDNQAASDAKQRPFAGGTSSPNKGIVAVYRKK